MSSPYTSKQFAKLKILMVALLNKLYALKREKYIFIISPEDGIILFLWNVGIFPQVRPHGVTNQKTDIDTFIPVRTSDLIYAQQTTQDQAGRIDSGTYIVLN
jgi:hypothetical protein